jgi:hypothetical protein
VEAKQDDALQVEVTAQTGGLKVDVKGVVVKGAQS